MQADNDGEGGILALITLDPAAAASPVAAGRSSTLAALGDLRRSLLLEQRPDPLDRDPGPRAARPDPEAAHGRRPRYEDDRITYVTARFGYMDTPDVPGLLPDPGCGVDCGLYEGRLVPPLDDRAAPRRHARHEPLAKKLFLATARITADAAEYFRLPRDRTVIMGSRIEL